VSEAVRGEGAVLVDDDGVRFMRGQHELADLAPRDVVAKAILRRMHETGAQHVWLDARHFGAERWRVRFPTIHETLLALGIDPVRDLIPVVPACHYASGGVRTNLHGESSLPGLFVCGESACTGVHGANRLASNSLLEGLVFGQRIAQAVMGRLDAPAAPPDVLAEPAAPGLLLAEDARAELQALMSREVGVLRDAKGLHAAADGLAALAERDGGTPGTEAWETTNLLTVSAALVHAAAQREETRGAHWRDDFPDRDDARWRGHLDTVLTPAGTLQTRFAPVVVAHGTLHRAVRDQDGCKP
jgi:L-aspartate oxidase